MQIPEKFLKKVNKTDTCWLWLGHINSYGYGRDNSRGYPSGYAHRAMFYWANGYLPTGRHKVVGHLCDVRRCVNPEHLAEQTQQENIKQYTDRVTHCPKGHEYNKANTHIRKNGARKCRVCNRVSEQDKRNQRKTGQ